MCIRDRFADVTETTHSVGRRRRDDQHRYLVDRRDLTRVDLGRRQLRTLYRERGRRVALAQRHRRAHAPEHRKESDALSGAVDVQHLDVRVRMDAPQDGEERGLGRIARHQPIAGQRSTGMNGDAATVAAVDAHDGHTGSREHLFGRWTGAHVFHNGRRSTGTQGREEDRRFHLRARHRHVIGDAEQRGRADDLERSAESRALAGDPSAHQCQRLGDPVHRAL